MQIEHHKSCSENSARLLPKGKYWRERFLMLGKQLPNVQITHADRLCFSSTMFWLIRQTNTLGTAWTCQSVFAAYRQSWLWLASCWSISSVLCRFVQSPQLDYTTLMQILRMLLERPHKNLVTNKLTLKGPFFVCLKHASSSFALYGQTTPEQGLIPLWQFFHYCLFGINKLWFRIVWII